MRSELIFSLWSHLPWMWWRLYSSEEKHWLAIRSASPVIESICSASDGKRKQLKVLVCRLNTYLCSHLNQSFWCTPHRNTPHPSNPYIMFCYCLSHAEFVFDFIHRLLCLSATGDQRQETIPAGSSAPSSQKDHPQTRAHRGAEAGDQGGLWTVWHRWVWIHWCQGAQSKWNIK